MSSVRIRFDKGETGWAEVLGDGKYRIDNVPLANDLNIDDVVTCEKGEDGFLSVVDVLERKYPLKTAVKYEKEEQYHQLREKVKAAGCKIEGMIGPRGTEDPGICIVAHDENFDLKRIVLEEVGIKTPQWTGQEDEVTTCVVE